jgi:general secretion pathway protein L
VSGRLLKSASRLRVELTALFGWWIHELRDLGEVMLLHIAPRFAMRVLVDLQPAGVEVWILRGGNRERVLCFSKTESVQLPVSLHGARATVALTPEEVLVHELRVPDTAKSDLDRIVVLYLEREFPLSPERICIQHYVAEHDRARRAMTVRILIAHRDRVEELRELVLAWGLRPTRVGVRGETLPIIGNFLQQSSQATRLTLTFLDRKLVGTAAVLTLGIIGIVGAQWGYERVHVGHELSRNSAAVSAAEDLPKKLQHESAPAIALTRLSASVDAADVLPVLTEVMPANSWAYQLDVTAPPRGVPQVKLDGFAPDATILIDVLEKSPRFKNVHLVSAVSAGLGTAQDRLQLIADWELK